MLITAVIEGANKAQMASSIEMVIVKSNPDMTKIIQELISLLEEQEKVKIDYELEKTA